MSMFNLSNSEEMGVMPYITQGENELTIVGFRVPEEMEKPYIGLVLRKSNVEPKEEYNKEFRLYYTSEMSGKISNARIIHMAKEIGIEDQVRKIESNNIKDFARKLNEVFKGKKAVFTIHGEEYISSNGLIKIKPVLPISQFCSLKKGKYPFLEEKHIKRLDIDVKEDDFTLDPDSDNDLPDYLK